jgi:Fe-S cluster assembly ATP-binding protein
MKNTLLKIKNLNASIETKQILKNFELEIQPNEIHVIMGPNGCGKSTLSKIIAGHPIYTVTGGTIEFNNDNLLEMDPEIRSHKGLFLAFQYPLEITGVSNYDFLRLAYNEKQKFLNEKEVTPLEFMSLVEKKLQTLKISPEFLNRDLNQGFSGGEKKKNEILQMLLLEPKLVILDELDSGLDMDAIKIICQTITNNLPKDSSLIIITHYPTILKYFEPNFVHIMMNGKIIKSGNIELVDLIEKEGYESF